MSDPTTPNIGLPLETRGYLRFRESYKAAMAKIATQAGLTLPVFTDGHAHFKRNFYSNLAIIGAALGLTVPTTSLGAMQMKRQYVSVMDQVDTALNRWQQVIPTTVAPSAYWDANFSTVTTSSGRVTGVSDIMGKSALAPPAATNGPRVRVNALGEKEWIFNGDAALESTTALSAKNRDSAVVMLVRVTKPVLTQTFFSSGRNDQTVSSAGGMVRSASPGPATLMAGARNTKDFANPQNMVLGQQWQLIAVSSRADGQRVMVNRKISDVTAHSTAVTTLGVTIGALADTLLQKSFMAVQKVWYWETGLSNANLASVVGEIADKLGITELNRELLLVGDSIVENTYGDDNGDLYAPASDRYGESFDSYGMLLTERGAGFPADVRVVNNGVGGATIGLTDGSIANSLYGRLVNRTGTIEDPTYRLPGAKCVLIGIGANDCSAVGNTAYVGTTAGTPERGEAIADRYIAYLTAATGYLAQGFTVVANVPAAIYGNTNAMTALRNRLRSAVGTANPTFVTAVGAQAGGTYAGKFNIVDLSNIESITGVKPFAGPNTSTTPNADFTDGVHWTQASYRLANSGGVTPSLGISSVINGILAA